jgi:hypothetical protein
MSLIEQQAERAAARVDSAAVGFDPITIITILTQVLPILLSCWNRNDSPDPAESAGKIRAYHNAHPNALRKRTARRIRAEAAQPMEKYQSLQLADAVIAQAIEVDPQEASLCCSEAPENL